MVRASRERPLVTVLITAYNEADHIEGAVRSALDQTYDNLEAVVINDGSIDDTKNILRRFDEERLRVFNQERRGRVPALNRGLEAANGGFVAVLDADDRCMPRRIEKQVEYLLGHEDVGVVGAYCHRKDSIRGEEYIRKYPTSDESVRRGMAKYIPIVHSSATFRKRAVLDVGGYNEALADHEDLDLWIRVAQDWTLANIPEPLVVRHIRSDSYWHRNFDTRARNMHLARLNAKAVRDLSLPFYYYAYPVARLVYPWLPDSVKRIVRRLGSGIEEQDLEDSPPISAS